MTRRRNRILAGGSIRRLAKSGHPVGGGTPGSCFWPKMKDTQNGGRVRARRRITMAISLTVNGVTRSVEAEPDTRLLYVLRNDFELNGAKFGCGRAQCGACAVLINGAAVRSCVMPIANLGQNEITTLEGLGTLNNPHPLQKAFIDEQ